MKGFKLDSYGIYARAFPVYITIVPVALVLFSILPAGIDWQLGGLASFVFLPISYLCRQIGGDFGKKRESALWDKWDGPPTTRLLRHGNTEFNQITRNRIHDKLRSLGFYIPSREEQEKNPQAADDYYESCVYELRRLTRDRERFPRIFEELRDYGFRRNIFALKPYGLTIAALSFLVCLIMGFDDWKAENLSGLTIVPGSINLGLTLVWIRWFTEEAVRITADRYAHFLLEASLDLEAEDGDSSLPKR